MRVNNGTGTLTWGAPTGNNIKGTLMLSSPTSANVTTFQNGINLNGANRTIQVLDNPNSTADYAVISGAISGTSVGITKTGNGLLSLTGTNTYTGTTTISGGRLQATIGTGIPTSSFLRLDGGVYQSNGSYTFSRSLGNSGSAFQWTANGGGFSAGTGALTVNVGSGTALTWGTHRRKPTRRNAVPQFQLGHQHHDLPERHQSERRRSDPQRGRQHEFVGRLRRSLGRHFRQRRRRSSLTKTGAARSISKALRETRIPA